MTEMTVPLHVAEWSTERRGLPMVLLHGLGNRWQAMAPLVAELARRGPVFAPDLRGHGRSPRANHYTVRRCALDVAALIEERRLGPVVVYGHSLGGLVGLLLAAEFPAVVRALVVGDAAVLARPGGGHFDVPEAVAQLVKTPGPLPKGVDPAVMDAFQSGRLLDDYDGPHVLGRVGCPVLLLRGCEHLGAHLRGIDARRALGLLADGQQAEIPGAGHQLQITSRRAVLAAMRPFLAEVSSVEVSRVNAA